MTRVWKAVLYGFSDAFFFALVSVGRDVGARERRWGEALRWGERDAEVSGNCEFSFKGLSLLGI